jgi:rubredoxin
MKRYICNICGYIYDPKDNEDIAFEELPEDWVCPECGVGKDQFDELD